MKDGEPMLKEFEQGQKRVSLEYIRKLNKIEGYINLADCVKELIAQGKIKPLYASKTNGKSPALYNEYHVIWEKKDNEEYREELKYNLSSIIDNSYYLKNIEKYQQDREKILQFNHYLINHKDKLEDMISLNERSFDIWGREKFLKEEGGKALLKNLNFNLEDLAIYETIEPISYYAHHKRKSQNVVIIENKDTYYSMRKFLLDGHNEILGTEIGTLIYGAGKGIIKSMEDFSICMEPYLCDPTNKIIYFGDLDYEGILIYESLYSRFANQYHISLFINAYETMIEKVAEISRLPDTKKGQNKNIGRIFTDSFNESIRVRMMTILEMGKYIPQEILNRKDFK